MGNGPFCAIVADEAPASVVHEGDEGMFRARQGRATRSELVEGAGDLRAHL